MSNITKLYPKGSAKDPDAVLEQCIGSYSNVLILGYDKDGNLDIRSTTGLSAEDMVFLIERFKAKLFAGDYVPL